MRATVRIDGLTPALVRINHVGMRALRPEPALRSMETLHDLRNSERRRFGKPFRPAASRDWVKEKRRRGLDPRTLHAHGRLESQLTTGLGGDVGVTVYNRTLRFGFLHGRASGETLRKVHALADKKRAKRWRFVVIDKEARSSIAMRIQVFVAEGH